MRPRTATLRVCTLLILRSMPHASANDVFTTATTTVTSTLPAETVTLTLGYGSTFPSSTSTIVSTGAMASTKNPSASGQALRSAVLNSTNVYRQHFEAAPLSWNETLADFASNHAKGCLWQHSGGPYGENLAAGYASVTLGIDAWAVEEKKYDYSKHKFGESTGHFTQLVWKATTQVGCGLVHCDTQDTPGDYLVCEYSPRGNVQGEFAENVRKPGMSADGQLGFGSAACRPAARSPIVALVVAVLFLTMWC